MDSQEAQSKFQDEWRLVQRCLRGDLSAWKEFEDRYVPWMRSLVRHALQKTRCSERPEDAEEVLQEILSHLKQDQHRVLKTFPEGFSLVGWLRSVVAARCYPYIQKKRPNLIAQLAFIEPSLPHRAPDPAAESQAMDIAFEKLTTQERLLLTLYYFMGQRFSEISRSLEIPSEKVGLMIFNAREKLKKIVQPLT